MSEFARGFGEYVAAMAGIMVALITALILLALSRVTLPALRHLWHRASPLGRLFGALLFLVCSINATTKAPSRTAPKRVAASSTSQVVYSSDKTDRVLTVEDFSRGFVQARVGTDEAFDFTPPANATICRDWKSFGVAEDWFYLSFPDWAFPVGTNKVSRFRIHSNGKVDLWGGGKLLPLATNLGLTPSTSPFWHYLTPSNTLQLTWQNALYNRMPETPISVQAELFPNGTFTYRYDFSPLDSENITNILVGAAFKDKLAGATNTLPIATTSISYYPLSPEDAENPDRDEDGIPLIDELFVYGTDPNAADTDFDGLSDYDEIAIGTNPLLRDTDGDGIVDGSDPNPTAADTLDDFDDDGIPDVYENYWFGGTNVVDSTSDYGVGGFSFGFMLSSGMNPTNVANEVVVSANSIAAWKITDGFVAQTDGMVSNIYERTFRISRNGGWEQFFISSKPDTFGNCISKLGTLADFFRHRFSTKYFDSETALYYYGYRFYHPTLMRWLTRDPIEEEGGVNLYALCVNCPVMNIDPIGKNIYLYTGNDSGNPLNDAFHQTIAVDTWSNDCPPKKTGVRGFSFAYNGEWGWNWPNGEWLGHSSISLPGYWMVGEIYEASVVGRVVKTKKTTPKQDMAWLRNMINRVGTKDVYSVGRHNCRAFSQTEFDKVQAKEDYQ